METPTREYGLVVIGGGPAGVIGATTAASLGKTAALIDNHRELGGAGINTGTVPSKTLRETALALSAVKSRDLYGVDLSLRREATVSDFLHHERRVKTGLNAMLTQKLGAFKVNTYCGTGSFVDPHTIRVVSPPECSSQKESPVSRNEWLLHGEHILIATGSAPFRPDTFPFDSPGVYDSDTILELDRLPQSLAVVGAGVVGSEYACTFAVLGTQVHLIERRDALLPFLDIEISRALVAAMEREGIVFHWNSRAETCTATQGGVTLRLKPDADLTVDAVLVAAGRTSNVEHLNLPAAGVAVAERGLIPVDEHSRTNVPHIYAAGDVIGFPALASTSMEQARRAIRHAMGMEMRTGLSQLLPHGIYTIPEVGTIGDTEEALKARGVDYVVGRAFYRDTARGRIIGDPDGFLKLIFRREDMRLLGAHIMGEHATDVVHIGMMGMLAGVTAEVFDEACFNLPTLGELYKYAAFDALFHTTEVEL